MNIPELAAGEEYAGLIIGKDGETSYHLVLLPGDNDEATFADALEWANGQGGELPTSREQSLLFANLKDCFARSTYWSAQEYEPNKEYAWCQGFNNGCQYDLPKFNELRARAVRRLPI